MRLSSSAIVVICVPVALACLMALSLALPVLSQETTRPAGGGVAERFRQLDRNSDGKLSRAELEAFPRLKAGFDNLDANHDGGVSLEEMNASVARWQQRLAEKEEPPATSAPPKRIAPRKPATTRPATMDSNSPQFRGPRGDGVAYGSNLPVTWSTTSNVVWSCTIPGKGWSSPVVWGDRVFVTSAVGPGGVEAPPEKLASVADHVRGVTTTDEHRYMLYCVDWGTGKLLWSRCAHEGVPPGPIHPKNTYASETPVTDGERVYAYFGNVGLFCYDMDGRELWSRKWGSFKMGLELGHLLIAGAARRPVVRAQRQSGKVVPRRARQTHRQGCLARGARREEQLDNAVHLAE